MVNIRSFNEEEDEEEDDDDEEDDVMKNLRKRVEQRRMERLGRM
jgi:hypothetical protein